MFAEVIVTPEQVIPTTRSRKCVAMQERWLSVDQISAHLGVNPDTIYKWIGRKGLPAHKVGRLWKFLASDVDQWVKGGQAAQRPSLLKKRHIKHRD